MLDLNEDVFHDYTQRTVRIDGKPTTMIKCTAYFKTLGETEDDRDTYWLEFIFDTPDLNHGAAVLWRDDMDDCLGDYDNVPFGAHASDAVDDLSTVILENGKRLKIDNICRVQDLNVYGCWSMTRRADMESMLSVLPKSEVAAILVEFDDTLHDIVQRRDAEFEDDDDDDFGANDGYEDEDCEPIDCVAALWAAATSGRDRLRIHIREINTMIRNAVLPHIAQSFSDSEIDAMRVLMDHGNGEICTEPEFVYWFGGKRRQTDEIRYGIERLDPYRYEMIEIYNMAKSMKK